MRNSLFLILLCLLLCGCGTTAPTDTSAPTSTEPENLMIGNPWVSYDSMEEAEEAVGFDFTLPETVAGSYQAESFRVMAGTLMEVMYRDDAFLVTVRQQPGEGQDISGDYRTYDSITVTETDKATITFKSNGTEWLHLISCNGYSYSMYAPNKFWGDSCNDFTTLLTQ